MASDTFDISAEQIASVNSQLETMNSNINDINRSSALTANMMAQIPNAIQDAGNVFKNMVNEIKDMQQDTARTAQEANNLATNLKKVADELDKAAIASDKTSKNLEKSNNLLAQSVVGVGKWALGLAGLALGFKAIGDKLIEYVNNYRKISGYGTIVSAQFEKSNARLQSMSSFMNNLRFSFHTSVEEAGEFGKLLSRAGLEQANIIKYGREIYAIEQLTGQSAKDQINSLQNLVGNYQMIEQSAMNYNSLMRQIAIKMPDLSFDTVLSDIKEVNENQKMWNSNILTSTSLYEVLTNKNLAKTLGMDKIPIDLRRAMSKGISGINKDMSMEWKAAIALSMADFKGKSPAAAILGFEELATKKGGLAMQFKGVMDFVGKHSGINKGLITPESIIKARQLLSQINIPGMSPEIVQKIVANMTPGKAFDTTNLSKLIEKSISQENELAKAQKKQDDQRAKDLQTALGAIAAMTPLQRIMADKLEAIAGPELFKFFNEASAYFSTALSKLTKELGIDPKSLTNYSIVKMEETSRKNLSGKDAKNDERGRYIVSQVYAGIAAQMKKTKDINKEKELAKYGTELADIAGQQPAGTMGALAKQYPLPTHKGLELGFTALTSLASATWVMGEEGTPGLRNAKYLAEEYLSKIQKVITENREGPERNELLYQILQEALPKVRATILEKENIRPGNTVNKR